MTGISYRTIRIHLLLCLAALLLLPLSCKSDKTEKQDLLFFFLETCPSCEDYIKAEELGDLLLEIDRKKEWKTASYNVANPENGKVLRQVLNEKSLPDISRSLPLLIAGDEYLNGYSDIEEELNRLSRQ